MADPPHHQLDRRRRLPAQIQVPDPPPHGDVIFIDGSVIRKFEENGKKYVEIQQQAITHRDEVSAFGTAIAELPSRG